MRYKLKNWVTKEKLKELYWKRGKTLKEIAKRFDVKYPSIIYWMKKFGIKRRKVKIYKKKPFNGNVIEKAYLIGLRIGDLNVKMHSQQILVRTTTTHLSMANVFKEIFEKYAPVKEILIQRKQLYLYTLLDKSFSFLLKKHESIPRNILNNNEKFYAFLSGYVDAEGCLCITKNKKGIRYHFVLASEDKGILCSIKNALSKDGYRVSLRIAKKKGTVTGSRCYHKDYWELRIYSKKQVVKLLKRLSLKHEEKNEWKRLMLKLKGYKSWKSIKNQVYELRDRIDKKYLVKNHAIQATFTSLLRE